MAVTGVCAHNIYIYIYIYLQAENDENISTLKLDSPVDEGKEWLNPSRDKNQGTHRRRKVD